MYVEDDYNMNKNIKTYNISKTQYINIKICLFWLGNRNLYLPSWEIQNDVTALFVKMLKFL